MASDYRIATKFELKVKYEVKKRSEPAPYSRSEEKRKVNQGLSRKIWSMAEITADLHHLKQFGQPNATTMGSRQLHGS